MKERVHPHEGPVVPDRKVRKCLRCNKKTTGRWLCPRCEKLNAAAGEVFDRYELHGLSISESNGV